MLLCPTKKQPKTGNGKANFFLLQQTCNDICKIEEGILEVLYPYGSKARCTPGDLLWLETLFCLRHNNVKSHLSSPHKPPGFSSGGWCRRDAIPHAVKICIARRWICIANAIAMAQWCYFKKYTRKQGDPFNQCRVLGVLKIQELFKLQV